MSLKCSSAEWKNEATWDLPSISLWGLTSVGIVSEHFLRPSRAAGEARELLPAWYWAGPVGAWEGHAQGGCTLAGNMPSLPALGPGERPGWHRRARSITTKLALSHYCKLD